MLYFLSAYADGNITIKEALLVSVKGILIVMLILAVVAVMVQILSKIIRRIRKKAYERAARKAAKKAAEETAWVKLDNDTADTSSDEVELIGTDEKTAAVIMAIVSKESKVPLERLKFNSIRLVESEDSAK